jgi:multimeric flavodoxin WrbA
LVEEVLRCARISGHKAKKLYLYEYNILPCLDCRLCKKAEGGLACSLPDGMQGIYQDLEASDLIIFGTPIYWYGPTAKMKLFIDRLRPFIANGRLKGKKGIIVVPSEEGAACCSPLMEMFRMSFNYLGMEMAGSILAKAYDRGEIEKNPEDLTKAFDLGASLRSNL